jgi:hypothetical protein
MANTNLPCLAVESHTASYACFFMKENARDMRYVELVNDPANVQSTVTSFDLVVDDLLSPQRIEEVVNIAMAQQDYVVNARRYGCDSYVERTAQPYQTKQWRLIHQDAGALDPLLLDHLIEKAKAHQKAYASLMQQYLGNPSGVECVSESGRQWGFVCPNVRTQHSSHQWRLQHFDVRGFSGHECFDLLEDAVEALVRNYPVVDRGALDRVAAAPPFATGLRLQEEHDLMNRGLIPFAEFIVRCRKVLAFSSDDGLHQAF